MEVVSIMLRPRYTISPRYLADKFLISFGVFTLVGVVIRGGRSARRVQASCNGRPNGLVLDVVHLVLVFVVLEDSSQVVVFLPQDHMLGGAVLSGKHC